jgi:hypothetical protein
MAGFPIADLLPPKSVPGTFTAKQTEVISKKLAIVGLDCKENTPEKVGQYAQEIKDATHSGSSGGISMVVAAPRDEAKDFEYSVDNSNTAFNMMKKLLDNVDKIQANGLYYVATHEVSNTFKSTTLGAIKQAFSEVGKTIGQVENGTIDPGQVVALMGNVIETLTDTTSNDFHHSGTQMLFCVAKSTDSKTSPVICGVHYSFEMSVHDVTNKKRKEHDSSYSVKQSNMVFTDGEIFKHVYDKLM